MVEGHIPLDEGMFEIRNPGIYEDMADFWEKLREYQKSTGEYLGTAIVLETPSDLMKHCYYRWVKDEKDLDTFLNPSLTGWELEVLKMFCNGELND